MTEPLIEVSLVAAFIAGIISFISPCILPLIPGYISLVTKVSFEDLQKDSKNRNLYRIFFQSLIFVLGFSFVFIILGASASFLGSFVTDHRILFLQLAGLAIIIFGFFTMEIIRIPQLYRERRFNIDTTGLGSIGTFLLGSAFGFAWTPCIGPILASILLYAGTADGMTDGALLLFIYSLGLGLPFILTGLAFTRAMGTFRWIRKNYGLYKYSVGIMLVLVGLLMVSNKMYYLNIYAQKIFMSLGIDFWTDF